MEDTVQKKSSKGSGPNPSLQKGAAEWHALESGKRPDADWRPDRGARGKGENGKAFPEPLPPDNAK
jgi:hypothetical protein